jgi:hypothetical protein
MIKLTRTGVGVTSNDGVIRDSHGSGLLPIQAAVTGTATFRVVGRVAPSAPWVEIKASGSADFLEAISFVPYLQLEVLSGTGTVDLYIGEN